MPEFTDFKTAADILDHMKGVLGEREGNYDNPLDNFQRIADGMNWYLKDRFKPEYDLDVVDVANLMIICKMGRAIYGQSRPHKDRMRYLDHYLDIVGYGVCLIRSVGEQLKRAAHSEKIDNWMGRGRSVMVMPVVDEIKPIHPQPEHVPEARHVHRD